MHVTIKSTSGVAELLDNINESLEAIPPDMLSNYDFESLRVVATSGVTLKLTLQKLIDTANILSSQRGIRSTTLMNKQSSNKVKVRIR